jgi:MarR family transcriptional regulator, organic hydroperoxide resistance regulator
LNPLTPSEASCIFVTIHEIQKQLEKRLYQSLSNHDITVPQIRVMSEIAQKPGMSVKDLTAILPISQSTISGIIERLEKKGLLRKTPHPSDRRLTLLYVSEETQLFLSTKLNNFYSSILEEHFAGISEDEKNTVIKGISILETCLNRGKDGKHHE